MPPSKKRRITAQETQEQDKHTLFTQWSVDRGVVIGSVKPSRIPGRGVGLVTTSKIKKDEQIIFVPERAMFKPSKTTAWSRDDKPAPLSLASPSPQAQLAMSITRACLNSDSSYHRWKETWPTLSDFESSMPLFWSEQLCGHLPESAKQPLERMREDYAQDLTFMQSLYGNWKEKEFKYFWAIVNSRSFHFKPPGAKPGYMVLCPFVDYMNHGPTGTGVEVSQTPKGYEVKADRDYEPNTEILATYGSHPNDKLLVHYGFVNSSTPGQPSDDDIRLDHIILPALSSNTRSALQDVGMLGSYALLPPCSQRDRDEAELCFKTQVAVRAELLTANEWEYFMLNGEDMTSDQSERVREWLRPKAERYREQSLEKLSELEELEKKVAEGSADVSAIFWLKTRWLQIADALEAWLGER